jgi:hypothetical protein
VKSRERKWEEREKAANMRDEADLLHIRSQLLLGSSFQQDLSSGLALLVALPRHLACGLHGGVYWFMFMLDPNG